MFHHICIICGREFDAPSHNANVCSQACRREKLSRLQKSYRASRPGTYYRVSGISPERASAIAYLQDNGTAEQLAEHAKTWTRPERTYARRRYEVVHGLFNFYSR